MGCVWDQTQNWEKSGLYGSALFPAQPFLEVSQTEGKMPRNGKIKPVENSAILKEGNAETWSLSRL